MNAEPTQGDFSVPIRRTLWTRFWIGAAAIVVSLLLAAALSALLALSSMITNGAVVLFVFSSLFWCLCFFSVPWQRRVTRRLDGRRPGIRLANGILAVPVTDDRTLQFNLDEPYELRFGWFAVLVSSGGGPITNTRAVTTFAMLAQAGQQVFLKAEDSVRDAQAAGWPKAAEVTPSEPAVRLWAKDIVALVETMRTRPSPTVAQHQPAPPEAPQPAPPPERPAPVSITEWPHNPLQARNRNEALLYLERQKVEIVSRSAVERGEIVLGRTPESGTDATPYLYRFVFALLEADPEDENDFGSGVSRILDPMEFMVEIEKLERADNLGTMRDFPTRSAIALTYRPTREVAAIKRRYARAIALIDQVMRFAQADGWPAEESFQTKTALVWYRRTRERFHLNVLSARQQTLREALKFWELPITNLSEAQRQAVLVQALRECCPDYLVELRTAGFEDEQIHHPEFMHRYYLAVFAARALQQGRAEQAEAAFAAWTIAQPIDLYFPTKEFAEAVYELKVDRFLAASLVPERQRNYFGYCYRDANPDNNPYGY